MCFVRKERAMVNLMGMLATLKEICKGWYEFCIVDYLVSRRNVARSWEKLFVPELFGMQCI